MNFTLTIIASDGIDTPTNIWGPNLGYLMTVVHSTLRPGQRAVIRDNEGWVVRDITFHKPTF